MTLLLAVETIARSASACVYDTAAERTVESASLNGAESDAHLVPMLAGLYQRHGVPAALAVAAGPGSFTGLRVGITALRTLAWADGLLVHPVCSLVARAAEAGPGLWWVLLSLKRDVTFHGLYRVGAGRIEVLREAEAAADESMPALHPLTEHATAIGPALKDKPDLTRRWCPAAGLMSQSPLTAYGVAVAARHTAPVPWDKLLPRYLMASAPELQRQRAQQAQQQQQ